MQPHFIVCGVVALFYTYSLRHLFVHHLGVALVFVQVAMETTIGNSNPALWKYVVPENAVMEWLRNIVANRLAQTGKQWADIFSKFNSGTYVCVCEHTNLVKSR